MRQERIKSEILESLKPQALFIEDESHTHAGRGRETHFKVLVVSVDFQGKSRLERQRMVNDLLGAEFKQGLHALTLRCLTPDEYDPKAPIDFASPNCVNAKSKVLR